MCLIHTGDTFVLTVERTVGAFGSVAVSWSLSSDEGDASRQFAAVNGTVTLLPVSHYNCCTCSLLFFF